MLNQPVNNFAASATSETTVQLADLAGQQVLLDFRDLHEQFTAANTVIFGISRDTLRSHENFKAKHSFPFELISDTEETLCKQFDVIKEKNTFGKKHFGIERSTFLIDAAGVLRHEWRKVKVAGHAAEVLTAAQALHSNS